ncbi:hypothetical protein [Sphaerisporangium perillae]|uniref:hypothetical protein n=1 Tax=Sphaerisporangium perillae TaxID=2935860 RepID=UPI00200DB27C|nr:hypothetical protein [Sphaerisporangium perillae]
MRETAQRAATLRPYLSASITEAGTDWPAGPGAEVLDRCRQFLLTAQHDLTWRVQTIERTENATARRGVKGAEFAFPSAESAHAAGAVAGDAVKAAWTAYQSDPSSMNWRRLQSVLGERQGKTSDVAYAAGLLTQMGAATFAEILRVERQKYQNSRSGYSPADLARVRNDLGPLADAFASADSTGKLPADLRARLLDHSPMDDLAALLALTPQSRRFVVDAGTKLAESSGHKTPDPDWNTHWLAKALSQDLGAAQEFLATGDNVQLLLRPEVVKSTGTPGFEKLLADVLDKALAPNAGDDNLRRAAWINTIKLFSNHSAWPSLAPSISETTGLPVPSPVGQVLARHIHQYFPELAGIWTTANLDERLATPNDTWRAIKSNEIVAFFGSILRDPAALSVLKEDYRTFIDNLDLGKDHPFGNATTEAARQLQRNAFYAKSSQAAGMASLLIGGLHEADLSAEEARDVQIQLMFFPVDMAVGAFSGGVGGGLIAETAIGKAADFIVKNPGQDIFSQLWDGAPPEEASDLTNTLLGSQIDALTASRRQHGLPPLSDGDMLYLENTFRGLLLPVVLDAFKKRGG